MYEFANCMSTPANDDDVDDKQSAALSLALAADTSLRHHQTGVISSTTGAVHGRDGADVSLTTRHNDDYSPTSSTSPSSSPAAASLSKQQYQRPAAGSADFSTAKEPLDYVNGLRVDELFGGANVHFFSVETVFTDHFVAVLYS